VPTRPPDGNWATKECPGRECKRSGGPAPQAQPLLEKEILPEQKYNLAYTAVARREFTRKQRGSLGGSQLKQPDKPEVIVSVSTASYGQRGGHH